MSPDDILRSLRSSLQGRLTSKQRRELRRFIDTRGRGLQHLVSRLFFGSNLDALAMINSSDKNTVHRYTQHYARHFAAYRYKPVKLLEIGVGGYDAERDYSEPTLGGGSLRMWRTYFPRGMIYGIDIYDKSPHNERRIKIFQGSQADTEFLRTVLEQTGSLDIIVDDGSHRCDHVITSFEYLFPRMSASGVYVIEDVETSYREDYGGNDQDPDRPDTTMGYFKRLVQGVNYEERRSRTEPPTYFEQNILGISFYHNLIVIEKGANTEGGVP